MTPESGLAATWAGSPSDVGVRLTRGPVATRLGRYIILDLLGSGGMGLVYSAFDPQLDRRVAVKVLRPEVGDLADRQRLLREAKAMARLAHPNVVAVYDAGEEEGQAYVAMEFVRGASLRQWLRGERSWEDVISVFIQAGQGLQAAHEVGLVHRDFKPDNVLLTEDGVAKVADFGLARGGEATVAEAKPAGDADTIKASQEIVTQDGMLVGTPAYMSPEQFLGSVADARCDQFSYFVALYEALYGHLPFEGRTLSDRVINITSGHRAPRPATTSVPRAVDRVLDRGLRARREERWPTMKLALEALRAAAGRRRGWWRRQVAWGVGSVAVVGAVILGVQWRVQRALDERMELCKGAERALAGAWDVERRGKVKKAFLDTGLPYAQDSWMSVEKRLDAFSAAWVEMHTESCESTHLRGEQSNALLDLRMACLQRSRLEMRSLVDVYVDADDGVVEHAVEALEGLSRLERCADVTTLLASPKRTLDDSDPVVVATFEGLAQARALEFSANYALALEHAIQTREKASSTGDRALVAEARLLEGQIRDSLGELTAGEVLEDAFFLAEELDDPFLPALASLDLMSHTTVLRDTAGADMWARHTRALLERVRARKRSEYDWLNVSYLFTLGTLSVNKGLLAEAEDQYRSGLRQAKALLDTTPLVMAGARNNFGNLLVLRGDLEEAAKELHIAAALYREQLGEHHPLYGASLNNLATLDMHRGEWGRARDSFERVLSIFTAALGAGHPNVGVAENNLGDVALHFGKKGPALEHYSRSLEIFVASLGPDAPALAYPLTGIGEIELERGDLVEARALLERALVLRGADRSHESARTRFALARALDEESRPRALQLAAEARTLYEDGGAAYASELEGVVSWIAKVSLGP